jgi:hypothetical protein
MEFLKKLKDNVIFAMNLSNEIPEHIRQEIIRKEKLRLKVFPDVNEFNADVKKKSGIEPRLEPKLGSTVEVEPEPELEPELEPEPELETEEDINNTEHVQRVIYNALKLIMNPEIAEELIPDVDVNEFNKDVEQKLGTVKSIDDAELFFDSIVGYSDIKKIMLKCISSSDREPVHVILNGPPASAKSMFLMAMKNR